ncbi:MAG TPA: AraC family transcriptional regulator [Gaiellaceae bacterium]|nr:AraC family transcriptional regulator [Gaiellaceae bacterium]
MNAGTDTFARFVAVLAETLDEPETSGSEIARRLHLSPFHANRLIAAATGEPPGALRRRILLERAAYRLVSSGDGLLTVALDAGYSSHEAFTRAFKRAYGVPPSEWRRRPKGMDVASPNGIHFKPPGSLRLPAEGKVTEMNLVQRLVEHHVWLVGELTDRAENLRDDVLDAPIEISVDGIDENPTVRSLLARLVGQLAMWNAAVRNEPYDFDSERNQSVGCMKRRLAEAGPEFLATVRSKIEEGNLDETFVDAVCDPPEVFTYGGMIAHVLTFAAHRRILVLGAFADAGITDLGSGDPMRYVADAA